MQNGQAQTPSSAKTNGNRFSRGEGFSTASLMSNDSGTDHTFDGPGGLAFRLNPTAYKGNTAAQDGVASFVNRMLEKNRDPAAGIDGAPLLYGQDALPHVGTFQSHVGTQAKTYLPSDESLDVNPGDALLMRKDLVITECLDIRKRMTALLDWSIVPENDKSPAQKSLAAEMTKILNRIPDFTDYMTNLMDAIWIGRSGVQNRYRYTNVGGRMYQFPQPLHADDNGWKHIHGDKLVFRYDDGKPLPAGAFPDQMGIRVSPIIAKDARIRGIKNIEYTTHGAAYFLSPAERATIVVHKHMMEDAEYENVRKAGRIHGVGIRDRIYNTWFLKQEMFGFLMEYLERSAGGIEIYEYPSGDAEAKRSIMETAKNRMAFGRNQIFFPKPLGMDAGMYDMRVVEPGFAGIDMLLNIIDKFLGHQIKRYMLGQTLSTEADATGLGSGVADLHKDTLSQIIRYDSGKLAETITRQLVRTIQLANWKETEGWHFDFRFELESDNVKELLDSYQTAWAMGAGIPEKDVTDAIGVSLDNPNQKILRNASAGAAPGAGMAFPAGTGFQSAGKSPVEQAHEHVKVGREVRGLKDQVHGHMAAKLGDDGQGGEKPPSSSAVSAEQYARQMELAWNESEHPRAADGEFVSKESGDSSGKVKMRQAKAGGEVSEVDGVFYKGGRLMPVHGLYSGREKSEPKPKKENPFEGSGLPEVNEDGRKGLPMARRISSEDSDAASERKRESESWAAIKSGPVGDLFWTGEKPGKFGFDVKKKMVPFLERLTNDQIESIGEFARGKFIEHDMAGNRPPGMSDDNARKMLEEDFESQAESSANMLLTNKIRKQFPAMGHAVEGLRMLPDLPDWRGNLEGLNELIGGFEPDKYERRSSRLLSEAAAGTHTSPSQAQIEAGNYPKGIFLWRGLEIAIENPKGSTRTKTSPSSGRTWSRKMASHYGYFRRTTASDGDQLDVFIGNHPDSDFVLVIKQVDKNGKFDEFKVVIGCINRKQAKKLYLANYPKGWKCGQAAGMTVEVFKKWVASGGPERAKSLAKVEC